MSAAERLASAPDVSQTAPAAARAVPRATAGPAGREQPPRGLTTKQWLSRWLARRAGAVAAGLPLRVGYWCADRAGDVFYRFSPGYRGNVVANLQHVLGQDADLAALRALARTTFRYSARNFYDLLRLPRLSTEAIDATVRLIGSWQPVDAALARGKGVIFVTGHLGAFDVAGQLIPLHGYRCVLVTVRTVSEFVHEAVTYLRASKGFALEEATPGGLRRLMRALRQGQTIGLASDRDFLRNGVPVTFFGEETTLPPGAVRLALETGAAIVVLICRRHDRAHTLLLEEPFWLAKTGDLAADMQRGLRRIAEQLEHHIRATPEQWVMFQRVWPATPPPAIAVFPVGSPLEGRVLGGEASSLAAEPKPPPP